MKQKTFSEGSFPKTFLNVKRKLYTIFSILNIFFNALECVQNTNNCYHIMESACISCQADIFFIIQFNNNALYEISCAQMILCCKFLVFYAVVETNKN